MLGRQGALMGAWGRQEWQEWLRRHLDSEKTHSHTHPLPHGHYPLPPPPNIHTHTPPPELAARGLMCALRAEERREEPASPVFLV